MPETEAEPRQDQAPAASRPSNKPADSELRFMHLLRDMVIARNEAQRP